MSRIPTGKEIAARFQQDVSLKTWRRSSRGKAIQPPIVFEGAQKDLFDHLMELHAAQVADRTIALASLRNRADVLRHAAWARRVFRRVQGLARFPARTPLRPRVARGVERESCRVERVILESRPDYFVTGILYLPRHHEPPFPAMLHVPGHSEEGKDCYQIVPATLAGKGIAVFCYDPPGQGERDEYVDIATGRRTVRRACRMHGVAGDPAYLLGSNFGAYLLWDGMRCVDYLQSRPDIDGTKIGVSGTSGGGWASLWLGAIDTRIKAINSNCYLTSWRRRMEGRGVDPEPDPEQDPFGVLAVGVDAADLIVACAPRAVSLGVTLFDFFPVDGALASYAEAKRLFALAGLSDSLAIRVVDAGHAMTTELRGQCYAWMQRWLAGVTNPDETEPAWTPAREHETQCTPTGIVLTSLGGKTTGELNAERARKLALERRTSSAKLDASGRAGAVRLSLKTLLRREPVQTPVAVEQGEADNVAGISVNALNIRSDGDIWLSAHLWRGARQPGQPAWIVLSEKGPTYDWRRNALCRNLARAGMDALDLDPRGMGALAETFLEFVPLKESDLTYDAFLLGRPILGMRVADILRGVDALTHPTGGRARSIGVVGDGYGALLALFAGCLAPRIARVVEYRGLTSYSSLVWNRDYAWPVNMILPHALEHFDLPDVRAALAPRSLTIVAPMDQCRRLLSSGAAKAELAPARRDYAAAGAPDAFTVLSGPASLRKLVSACR